MSFELEGPDAGAVPSPAVNSAPVVVPDVKPAADTTTVDQHGFTAEDRAAAAEIWKATEAPLPVVQQAAPAAEATPTPAAPAAPAIDEGLTQLSQVFGVDLSQVADNASATSALSAVIDIIAQAGQQSGAPPAPAPAPTAPTVQAPTIDFSFDPAALADTSPELAEGFKNLTAKQQEAFKTILAEASEAKQLAQKAAEDFQAIRAGQVQQQWKAVTDRAESFLDSLNSPKFGSSANRTVAQRIEAEKAHALANDVIKGLIRYSGQVPTIETIMDAVARRQGVTPTAKAAPAPAPAAPAPIPPLVPRQAQGNAPAPLRSGVGSTGSGDKYMADAEFVNQARAILGS